MQKKIKYLIMGLLILLIIMILILVLLLPKIEQENRDKEINQEITSEREIFEKIQEDPSSIINGKKLEEVQSEGVYLTVANIIEKYIAYLDNNNSKAIYSMLDNKYSASNNLTEENVLDKLEKYSNYKIKEILRISMSSYGIYYSKIDNNRKTQFIMINWDTKNDTFSISPINEEIYNQGKNSGIEIDKDRITEIEKNEYNQVIVQKVDDDGIAQKYFYDLIEKMLYYTQDAYEMLDNEYKQINFSTYDEFIEYVNNNKEKLQSLDHNNLKTVKDFTDYEEYEKYYFEMKQNKMERYAQTSKNGIKTYIFEDSNGKYYIFKLTAAFQYTVMLDNYTIPMEDFIKTYNSSSDVEKVILNIERFFMGINDKNYGYSYSVLSDSFKSNKYPTKEEFVKYVQENFFEENEIEYVEYKKENNLYIYEIKIKDATGQSSEEKSYSMIVKLNNGTNFEMSFGEN